MQSKLTACIAALAIAAASLAVATPASAQRWHRHYYGGGGAVLGGFAAGALLGGALAARPYGYYGYGYGPYYSGPTVYDEGPVYAAPGGDAEAYCMQRFKSYDPSSGTYLGYDGRRHPCP